MCGVCPLVNLHFVFSAARYSDQETEAFLREMETLVKREMLAEGLSFSL